jgi:DNA-binding SARP family transcriptional activator
MAVEIRLLGRVDALIDGRSLPLRRRKQRAVLAMLALRANRTVGTDDLIDGLWGERPPQTAAKNVQNYVSQLRKELASDDSGASIVTHGRGYELKLPEDAVDAARFERLVERARRTSPRSRSREPRSAASRSFTCVRSNSRSTPSSRRGDTAW